MTSDAHSEYVESWERRVIANAPNDETVVDVLKIIKNERFLNRGRWAALVVRFGVANRRDER